MEITLHHNWNFKTFKRYFPNAIFLGFAYGFHKPKFYVDDLEWEEKKSKLPKSCTVVKAVKELHNTNTINLRAKRAKKKIYYTQIEKEK